MRLFSAIVFTFALTLASMPLVGADPAPSCSALLAHIGPDARVARHPARLFVRTFAAATAKRIPRACFAAVERIAIDVGTALASAGRLDESIATERTTLAFLASEPDADPDDEVAIRFALGSSLLRIGAYDESASTLQSVAKMHPSGLPAVYALTLASSALRSSGRTAEADASLDAALALANADPDPNRKAFVLLWRARERVRDARYLDAEHDLNAVIDSATDGSRMATALRAAAFGSSANLALATDRIADAHVALTRSHAEFTKLPASMSSLARIATDEAYATLAIRLERYGDARATIAGTSSEASHVSHRDPSVDAELAIVDGVAALGNRRFVEAETAFARALHASLAVSRVGALGATALLDRSIAKRREGRFRAARLDLYASHAMLGAGPNVRLAERLDIERAILDVAMRDDRDGRAAFAAALEDVERDDAVTRDEAERVVDASLTFALDRPQLEGMGAAAYDAALFGKWSTLRSLSSSPARAPRWTDVRAALRPSEAAVEIVRFRRLAGRDATGAAWYVAVVLRADRPAPFVVELGPAATLEGDALASFRRFGVAPAARSAAGDASALSRLAWAPIANAVVGVRTVYVCADGELATIPLDALQNGEGSLAFDRSDGRVVSVASTSSLAVPTAAASTTAAVLIGDPRFDAPGAAASGASPTETIAPLPSAGDGVRDLARAMRADRFDARTFTGVDATRETLEARAPGVRIVHIATRATFLPDVETNALPAALPFVAASRLVGSGSLSSTVAPPLPDPIDDVPADDWASRSLLFFAGANRAIFTARDARTLDLRGVQLVTLETDATGLDSARVGGGATALRAAFLDAGARDVLTSLWSPPDREATELLRSFYARLSTGVEAHDALRAAQLAERDLVRKRYGAVDPYYWAGWTVIGPGSRS